MDGAHYPPLKVEEAGGALGYWEPIRDSLQRHMKASHWMNYLDHKDRNIDLPRIPTYTSNPLHKHTSAYLGTLAPDFVTTQTPRCRYPCIFLFTPHKPFSHAPNPSLVNNAVFKILFKFRPSSLFKACLPLYNKTKSKHIYIQPLLWLLVILLN